MAIELIDVLKKLADLRGTTLEHEVARHNVGITEQRMEWAANGRSLPAENAEEREARRKAARKRGVDKARVKRQAARQKIESAQLGVMITSKI